MFKKKDEDKKAHVRPPRDEHAHEGDAYEDSWYRSLKALRDAQESVDGQEPESDAQG